MGNDGVKGRGVAPDHVGNHRQQVGPVRVQLLLAGEGRVLPRVLPSLSQFLLSSEHRVDGGDPVAGVAVADPVEEVVDGAVVDGPGYEPALLLPLHELPAGVDQDDVVAGRHLRSRHAREGEGSQNCTESRIAAK